MYEIILKHTADKELKKIEKGDKIGALKIRTFSEISFAISRSPAEEF